MNVLYLTYDGLTDPIGQSQILPYLEGCAARGHRITVVSFEKEVAGAQWGDAVSGRCQATGLSWHPQRFHSSPPFLSKAYDLWTMEKSARQVVTRNGPFDLIHARSYQAGWIALKLKRDLGIPILFDMRGFWADQRRDGGRWRSSSPIGSALYRQWKAREAKMVEGADHIVVLTEAARNEIMGWPSYRGQPVSVIPCCADFSLFPFVDAASRRDAKIRLGFDADNPVLAYVGSIGTVYRYDAHLRLFDRIRDRNRRAKLLHIGADPPERIMAEAAKAGVTISQTDLTCRNVARSEVAGVLAAGDVATAFCTEAFSSKGVSPTKVGEYLACGVPVIANDAVGDMAAMTHELDCGHSMEDFSAASLDRAADRFFDLLDSDRERIRERAQAMYDLPLGIKGYAMIYDALAPLRLPEG